MSDNINKPTHYNIGSIEVIDAIEDWQLGYHAGNVVKYVARYQYKGDPITDLKKARWYLDRLIKKMETPNLSDITILDHRTNQESNIGQPLASSILDRVPSDSQKR